MEAVEGSVTSVCDLKVLFPCPNILFYVFSCVHCWDIPSLLSFDGRVRTMLLSARRYGPSVLTALLLSSVINLTSSASVVQGIMLFGGLRLHAFPVVLNRSFLQTAGYSAVSSHSLSSESQRHNLRKDRLVHD